ncbi:MAG: glycosyltransferase family 4 protein [Patescibacteria group bacterium]
MKIVIATPLYPPEIGGPATYSFLVAEELPKRGIGVVVVKFSDVRWWPKGIRHLFYLLKLVRSARGANLIYAQDSVSVGLPAMIVSRLMRKKFFLRLPGDFAWEQGVQRFGVKENIDEFQSKKYFGALGFIRYIQKTVARSADLVIVPSDYFLSVVAKWGVSQKKIVRIYNGIRSVINVHEDTAKSIKDRFFISAGRLVPWKGFDCLIEIMVFFPEFKLVIVGSGPDLPRLRNHAVVHGVVDQIIFTGSLSKKQLTDKLRHATLFLLHSSFESFSFQVVEAMATGVPVVLANIGSLPELVADGVSGYLVPFGNKELLIDRIKKICDQPDTARSFSRLGRLRAEQFTIERTLSELQRALTRF